MDHPDAALIEQVVRQVLLRLAERPAASVVGDAAAAVQSTPNLSPDRSTLLCDQTVVSVAWLEQRWAGQLQIQFGPRAVVTPAARDWLRSKQIESIRAAASGRSIESVDPAVLVAGSTSLWRQVAERICPRQARRLADQAGDDAMLREVRAALLQGNQKIAILWPAHPHALCWQAARDTQLRPAVLSDPMSIDRLLQEVPANLLMIDGFGWTPHQSLLAVRKAANRLSHHPSTRS
jgi:hypothetical protein